MNLKETKLKNNTITQDIRLDRIEDFDPRSKSFPISEIQKSKKLRSYTWRCEDWFHQEAEGKCVAYALGHELASRPSEVFGLTNQFLTQKIYWEAQKIDPWNGGAYPNTEEFYEGTSVLAGIKIVKQLGFIKSYRWAFSLEETLYGLGHNGPAVLGIPWFYDMYFPDSNGFIKPSGQRVGGHAILARAINVKEKYVTLRNSWGKDWGKEGDCYITFDDLENVLNQNGECAFLLNRTITP